MTDVRPEIEQLVAVEGQTAAAYQSEVDRFKDGRIKAEKLAQAIDASITPQLRAARAHLQTLTRVPNAQQPLITAADEYLRLRDESWRLRSEALHTSNMPTLRKADRAERASLEAFEKMRTTEPQ